MNEIDNEEIVASFEKIMSLFHNQIKPFAVDICTHLQKQYLRCMNIDVRKDEGAGMMTAVASFDSMRRILDVVETDPNL